MSTSEKELLFFNKDNLSYSWVIKFNEKLTLLLLKIRDQKDLTDDEYDLLKVLNKVYENGEYMIYKQKAIMSDEKATQGGLFSEIVVKDSIHDDLAQ